MKLPKSVTVLGVVLALAAVVVDPVNAPWLTDLLGAQASAKLAAVGAMLAALGRAIFATTPPAPPAP
jgi:hypothetical protein